MRSLTPLPDLGRSIRLHALPMTAYSPQSWELYYDNQKIGVIQKETSVLDPNTPVEAFNLSDISVGSFKPSEYGGFRGAILRAIETLVRLPAASDESCVAIWAAARLEDLRQGRRTIADLQEKTSSMLPTIAEGTRRAIALYQQEQP